MRIANRPTDGHIFNGNNNNCNVTFWWYIDIRLSTGWANVYLSVIYAYINTKHNLNTILEEENIYERNVCRF